MVKIKVCGITTVEDALRAVELGADALGFNFYPPSPRYIEPEKAREILAQIPSRVCNVALFVNEPKERVRAILAHGLMAGGRQAFGALQFHGEESGDYCRGWDFKVIKAFRIKDQKSLLALQGFPADFYLLDSFSPGFGGSGQPFPWEWLKGLPAQKLILAGGLDAQNVEEAIRRLHPYGVDVCSGVESRPGVKDHEKLKAFIVAAKAA